MNGTKIARIAYHRNKEWYNVGSIYYFRSHDVRIRLVSIPLWAISNKQWLLGTFVEDFKVEEAPYLSGDIVIHDKEEGTLRLGRIESYQNEDGQTTYYNVCLHALPAYKTLMAMIHGDLDDSNHSGKVWLDVELEDKDELEK